MRAQAAAPRRIPLTEGAHRVQNQHPGARDPSEETGRLLKGRPWRMARESWTGKILPDGVGFHLSRVDDRIKGGLEKWLESFGLLLSF